MTELKRLAKVLLPWVASTYEGTEARWEEELDRDSAIEAASAFLQALKIPSALTLDAAWAEALAENASGVWRDMLDHIIAGGA